MGFWSLDVCQPYSVPHRDGGPEWLAQMFHADDRVLVGGKIVSKGHVAALRQIGVTHVLSVDDDGDDSRLWLDAGTRRHVPLDDNALEHSPEKLYAIGRWLEPVLSQRSSKVYIHCHLGYNRGPAAGFLCMLAGGMGAGLARSRVFRGRVSTPDELGRLHSGWTPGAFPTTRPETIRQIERFMSSGVSLLDYGVRPLAR